MRFPPLPGATLAAAPPFPPVNCASMLQMVALARWSVEPGVPLPASWHFGLGLKSLSIGASMFHQLKWPTVARNASPVDDPVEATTVPTPSCVHRPVVSSSDHSGTVLPATSAEPSALALANAGISIVAVAPGASCTR